MGIFDFVKNAGTSLGSTVYDMTHKEDEAPDEKAIDSERIDELRQQNIMKSLTALDLDVDSVTVDVNGPVAVLAGSVPDQATCEKAVLTAGNQFGIAQVDCRLEVEKTEPEAVFYTVQSGDTLSGIAKAHYGNPGLYMKIFEANQPLLSDPNRIYPGQQLRIPPAD